MKTVITIGAFGKKKIAALLLRKTGFGLAYNDGRQIADIIFHPKFLSVTPHKQLSKC